MRECLPECGRDFGPSRRAEASGDVRSCPVAGASSKPRGLPPRPTRRSLRSTRTNLRLNTDVRGHAWVYRRSCAARLIRSRHEYPHTHRQRPRPEAAAHLQRPHTEAAAPHRLASPRPAHASPRLSASSSDPPWSVERETRRLRECSRLHPEGVRESRLKRSERQLLAVGVPRVACSGRCPCRNDLTGCIPSDD